MHGAPVRGIAHSHDPAGARPYWSKRRVAPLQPNRREATEVSSPSRKEAELSTKLRGYLGTAVISACGDPRDAARQGRTRELWQMLSGDGVCISRRTSRQLWSDDESRGAGEDRVVDRRFTE